MNVGFRSIAVDLNGRSVVLIGRHPEALASYRREAALLPLVREHLTVAIPQPDALVDRTRAFPYGALRYPRLEGVPLRPEGLHASNRALLAEAVGRLMAELHEIPLTPLRARLSETNAPLMVRELERTAVPVLEDYLSSEETAHLRGWLETAHTLLDLPPSRVLLHGDLWYENLLVAARGDRLLAVVDFEAMHAGDPAEEVAPLTYLGSGFVEDVLVAYGGRGDSRDRSFLLRAEVYLGLRELGGIPFAIRHEDPLELAESVQKVQESPIFRGFLDA